MRVTVRTEQASTGIDYPNAIGTYQKGDFLCVFFEDTEGKRKTHKYPIRSIFRVEEDYLSTDKGKQI